jgi:hypothetical protein
VPGTTASGCTAPEHREARPHAAPTPKCHKVVTSVSIPLGSRAVSGAVTPTPRTRSSAAG